MGRLRGSGLCLLVALVVALLSACGDLSIPIPGMSSAATATPATKSGASPATKGGTTAQVGGLPAGFPATFPMPQGHQVQSGVDDGRQFAVVLTVSSAQEACDFYKGALPGAGYQVQDLGGANVGGAFSGGLKLAGNGFNGEVACTAVGGTPTVSIRLERGSAAQPAPTAAAGAINVPAIPPIKPSLPTPALAPGTTPGPSGPAAPGGLPAGFPANFPLPPQYQVQAGSDDGRQASVVLSVQSAQAGYDFYKGVLPLSGFQVREEGAPRSSGGIFTGGLSFTGNGLTGSMAFSSAGGANLISIGITRSGAAPATPAAKPGVPTPAPKPGEKPAAKPGAPAKPGPSVLPAGFPLPAEYTVQAAADNGRQIAVVLNVANPQAAFDFFKQELPGAGYQVTERSASTIPGGGFSGVLSIRGNGVSGEVVCTSAAGQNLVSISLTRS